MMTRLLRGCALGALLLLPGAGRAQSATEPPRVIGYLAAWSVRTKDLRIADIPAERLTHVCYAFGRVGADGLATLGDPCLDIGQCPDTTRPPAGTTGGNFAALRALKQRHPHLRVLISLGGWGGSRYFSFAAVDSIGRERLVRSTLAVFLRAHPDVFDGVDVDWEYPVRGGLPENTRRPEDRRNYTLLLEEYRRQLDLLGRERGRRYELSIAAAAGGAHVANLEVPRLAQLLDFLNIMTYDFHVGDTIAHFNAPLRAVPGDPTPAYNIATAVQLYTAAGMPPGRLVIGAPFYGRGYGDVGPAADGLLQRTGSPAPPEYRTLDYRTIVQRDLTAAGFTRHWQPQAQVPWLYHPGLRIWISHDDPESIAAKAQFVREQGLGGIMFWELGADDGSLLRAASDLLRPQR